MVETKQTFSFSQGADMLNFTELASQLSERPVKITKTDNIYSHQLKTEDLGQFVNFHYKGSHADYKERFGRLLEIYDNGFLMQSVEDSHPKRFKFDKIHLKAIAVHYAAPMA